MRDRRDVLTLALLATAGAWPGYLSSAASAAESAPMTRRTALGFSFDALEGPRLQLADYAGHPMLIVNTASLCGFTPQYAGLQELWTRFRAGGLIVIGVPSNDFGAQEPGDAKDIDATAHHQYGVTFPITAKTTVKGPNAHPFYKWAAGERPSDVPRWNFHKYLVGADGHLADAFASEIEPGDTRVVTAIARQINGATQQLPAHRASN